MTEGPTVAPREVAIATTIDDRWVPHFATCVASIAASRGRESVRFFMLQGPMLSPASARDLRDFVREHGMEFETITIPEESLASLPPTILFSPIVWYRLLLPELLPEHNQVVALDADTLVLQSLVPLYEQDLSGQFLGAVGQPATSSQPHLRTIGTDHDESYFNAGVMLMNLAAMRDEHVGPRAIRLGHEHYEDFMFAEQDALNVLARRRWKQLHPRWNALSYLWLRPEDADDTYSPLDRAAAKASPAVVHFEGFQTVKPWFYRSVHPLRNLYREYRAQTPWPLESLERKTVSGAVLRRLPIRSQHAVTRAKWRFRQLLLPNRNQSNR